MSKWLDLYKQLLTIIPESSIQLEESLCQHTYTRMGGPADLFVTPATYEEAAEVVRFARQHDIPITILGFGSNVIVRDGGIRGIVLSFEQLTDIRVSDSLVVAQSGAAIIDTSKFALKHSLSGLEFACGIPGSVGGALYMNAGAYGGEISDVLQDTLVLTSEGELLRLSKEDLELGYRTSVIGRKQYIVLEATFKLVHADVEPIQRKMEELTYLRESKQPLEYPSCGSVFKRPPGYFAGQLIQESGLQGTRVGGAEVSTKHAGFIVNVDQATATEYIALIHHVQQTVKDRFNVELETEVRIIGEDK
ncbi:UDP-N-acetylmuramate dehydrogenase [Paenibacillus agilis]|uniref:UDP-N-acetylenolpyruvoylglucosamine reductase n=1 Tax=Paenibacillus agilis TaxID=3020863 RepID=A0A559IVP7_9BACL|nr:UDP-N-acetylmuramate dehydrogenase [Paenibacillus agilis]TVX91710.1 UDP-N-acetylmuramate dehydrogenase [Paenibacillus agilis]